MIDLVARGDGVIYRTSGAHLDKERESNLVFEIRHRRMRETMSLSFDSRESRTKTICPEQG